MLLLFVLLIVGCKSTKAIVNKGPVPERTKVDIFEALSSHNFDFEWFACESKITVDSPDQGISGKAYIRMKKDSIIWTVVKKLSLEGARTLVTPSSYAVKFPIDNTYQKGSTEDAFEKMGLLLDFTDVQQAIFGNVIIPDSSSTQIDQEGEHYIVKANDDDLQLKYWVNAYTLRIDQVKMIDYSNREILVKYSDYREANNGVFFPYYRHYTMPYNGQGDSEIFLKIKKIEVNIPKKTRFSIPSRYERIY